MTESIFNSIDFIVVTNYKTTYSINRSCGNKYVRIKLFDKDKRVHTYNNLSDEDKKLFKYLEKYDHQLYIQYVDLSQIFEEITKQFPKIKIIEI
jgi:hypothetical protein